MQKSKLGIDFKRVEYAKSLARKIADDVQNFADNYTTVAVERTIARILGIDGIDENGVPLPNIIVDSLVSSNTISQGIIFALGNAVIETGLSPQTIAEKVSKGEMELDKFKAHDTKELLDALKPFYEPNIIRIANRRKRREHYINTIGEGTKPYIYVIVATGNIYEDVVQAQAAARQGADVIAVIRTTGQSLLDYVPYGATTEGFGGTFATQENFRIMRKALDEVGEEIVKLWMKDVPKYV